MDLKEKYSQFRKTTVRVSLANLSIVVEGELAIAEGGQFQFQCPEKEDTYTVMECPPSIVVKFNPSPTELAILEGWLNDTIHSDQSHSICQPPRLQIEWDGLIANRCTINAIRSGDSNSRMFFFTFDRFEIDLKVIRQRRS